MTRHLRYFALVLALAGIYLVTGKLGLQLAAVHASATPVWAPTGIALAAFLLLGYRIWPGILLGAFLVNITTKVSLPACLGIASGNTLEGLVGAYLVNRFARGRRAFERPQDIFAFAALAAGLSTTVSATFGVTSVCLDNPSNWAKYSSVWLTWWLGDVGGDLIVAPLILLWAAPSRIAWNRNKLLEAGLLLITVSLVGWAVFGGLSPPSELVYPLSFLCLPALVWAAYRFDQRETATCLFVLAAIAVSQTLQRFGPVPSERQNVAFLLHVSFIGVTAVTVLVLSAALSERRRADEAVRTAFDELERRVEKRTAELSRANAQLRDEIAERMRAQEERDRMSAELLQGQKLQAIGQLAAGVAHEINNPVGFILSNFGTVEDYLSELRRFIAAVEAAEARLRAGGDPAQTPRDAKGRPSRAELDFIVEDLGAAIRDCREGAERISEIVRSLSAFAHPDEEGDLIPCDLQDAMERALRVCWNELKYKAEVKRDYGNVPPILAYPHRLEQVFMNLLMNAAQAIRTKGEIQVSTRLENHEAVVRIRDTGCGIPPEHLGKLFEPFFTTKPAGKGTGLGLHVAYKIVQAHDGRIDVTSNVGQGTEFTIRLPARIGKSEPAEEPQPAAPEGPKLSRHHVVVCVDDEPAVLSSLQRLLRSEPYEFLTTAEPDKALKWIEGRGVSLVIADQRMPKMLGTQLVEEVRRRSPKTACAILTGYSSDTLVVHGMKRGIPWVLRKPWDDAELKRTIRRILRGAEAGMSGA